MDSFTTEAFTLLAFGLSFIFFRLFARVHTLGWVGIKADDFLMVVAAFAYSAETALAYAVGNFWQGLANNSMSDAERLALDPSSNEHHLRVNGSKTQVAGWSTYTFLLWTLKASMCAFYLRLLKGLDYQRRIHIGFAAIGVSWVVVLLSILLGCRPLSKNWQIYPNPGNACQPAISRIDIFVTLVFNVITDAYLLSIPVPMLWAANLRPTKKAGLMVLFSGGVFVTVAGVLRCILIMTNPTTGAQQAGSWAVRETFVAVVTSNVPIIFPLVRRWCIPIFGSIHSGVTPSGGRKTSSRPSKKSSSGSGSGSSGVMGLGALSSKLGLGNGTVMSGGGTGSRGTARSSRGVNSGMFALEEEAGGEHAPRPLSDSARNRSSVRIPTITFNSDKKRSYIDDVENQLQQQQKQQQKRWTNLRVEEFQLADTRPSSEQAYVTALSPPRGGGRMSRELAQQDAEVRREQELEMAEQGGQKREREDSFVLGPDQTYYAGSLDTTAGDELDKQLDQDLDRQLRGAAARARARASYYHPASEASRASSTRSNSGGSLAATAASPLSTPSWYSSSTLVAHTGGQDNKRHSKMYGASTLQ